MLEENSIIPLYYQLKELIKEKIKGGSWAEGYKVPSERELMEVYHVSRATVRKALSELITEGFIYRKQGVGTFVAKSKIEQNLIGELSFNQQARIHGLNPSSKIVYAALEPHLANRIFAIFQLEENTKVHKIIRVRLVNNHPLILETLYIPQQYSSDILSHNLEDIAVFTYLNEKFNFTHSTLEIEPVAMNEFEAKYLQTEIARPALSLERIVYSEEQVIAIQKRIMRGDRGKFSFTLRESSQKKEEFSVGLEFSQQTES
jgi:GntR family transcriptional regulator